MATLRKRKDRDGIERHWELDWTDPAGRHRLILGPIGALTERQARDLLRAKQLELSTGARLLNLPSYRVITFRRYAHEYMLWHQSEYPHSTARVQQIITQHLEPVFGDTALDMITLRDGEEFKQSRRGKKAKAHTITKELRTLKAILNRAVTEKRIAENPLQQLAAPRILDAKPHTFYEADQLTALYAACSQTVNAGEGPQPDPLHAAIWKLFVNTGMRRGEGMALKRQWIGREGIKIISTGEERTKSGAWREVPKTEGAAEALDRLQRAGADGYVLPRVTLPSLSRAFAKDAHRAGLPGSLHTLRHTYISHLMRDTATPVRTIQLYAGHASIVTTELYAYLRAGLGDTPAAALNL